MVAFLPYGTLEFEAYPRADPGLVERARTHAAGIQARRGQDFAISACGQTVRLGRP
jgi:hypothetical protein